jgi:hypothetical protein
MKDSIILAALEGLNNSELFYDTGRIRGYKKCPFTLICARGVRFECYSRCPNQMDVTSDVGLSEAENKILDLDRSKIVKMCNVWY